MNYFLVSFIAAVDGEKKAVAERVGWASKNNYNPNTVKSKVIDLYKNQYPEAQQIAIVLFAAERISQEEYNQVQFPKLS